MSKDDRELIERIRPGERVTIKGEREVYGCGTVTSIEGNCVKVKWDSDSFVCWSFADDIELLTPEPAATRLEALQAQPVGERDREYWARVLHDAWPHTVISQALSEVTGLPIGTVLSWDAVKEAGADCSGLYRFADAVVSTLTASPPVVERSEDAPQRLQDHMEQHHGVCLPASAWDAAILALPPVEGVGKDDQFRNEVATKRRSLGWSLRDLEAETGIGFSTLARFERGERIGRRTAAHLAEWLSTPVAQGDEVRDAKS